MFSVQEERRVQRFWVPPFSLRATEGKQGSKFRKIRIRLTLNGELGTGNLKLYCGWRMADFGLEN